MQETSKSPQADKFLKDFVASRPGLLGNDPPDFTVDERYIPPQGLQYPSD